MKKFGMLLVVLMFISIGILSRCVAKTTDTVQLISKEVLFGGTICVHRGYCYNCGT